MMVGRIADCSRLARVTGFHLLTMLRPSSKIDGSTQKSLLLTHPGKAKMSAYSQEAGSALSQVL